MSFGVKDTGALPAIHHVSVDVQASLTASLEGFGRPFAEAPAVLHGKAAEMNETTTARYLRYGLLRLRLQQRLPDVLEPGIAQVADGRNALVVPEVFEERAARNPRCCNDIGNGDWRAEMRLNEVDRAPDVARDNRHIEAVERVPVVVRMR